MNILRRKKKDSGYVKCLRSMLDLATTIHNYYKKQPNFLEAEDVLFKQLRREIVEAISTVNR